MKDFKFSDVSLGSDLCSFLKGYLFNFFLDFWLNQLQNGAFCKAPFPMFWTSQVGLNLFIFYSRLNIPYQQLPCQSVANQNFVSSSPEDLNLPHPADKRSEIIKKKKKVKQPSSSSYVSAELRPPSTNSTPSPGHGMEYDEEFVW